MFSQVKDKELLNDSIRCREMIISEIKEQIRNLENEIVQAQLRLKDLRVQDKELPNYDSPVGFNEVFTLF